MSYVPTVPVDLTAAIAKYHGVFSSRNAYGRLVSACMDEGAVCRVFRAQPCLFVRSDSVLDGVDAAYGLTTEINAPSCSQAGHCRAVWRLRRCCFHEPGAAVTAISPVRGVSPMSFRETPYITIRFSIVSGANMTIQNSIIHVFIRYQYEKQQPENRTRRCRVPAPCKGTHINERIPENRRTP